MKISFMTLPSDDPLIESMKAMDNFTKKQFLEEMKSTPTCFMPDAKTNTAIIEHRINNYTQTKIVGFFNTHKYIEDVFDCYIIGNPILVKGPQFGNTLRKDIPANEIINSFPINQLDAKLFLAKDDAIYYARANQSGDLFEDDECYLFPIFHVKPTVHLDIKNAKTGHIYINEKTRKVNAYVPYFEINANELVPYEGQLTYRDTVMNHFIDYSLVKMDQSNRSQLSNQPSSFFKRHPIATSVMIGAAATTAFIMAFNNN